MSWANYTYTFKARAVQVNGIMRIGGLFRVKDVNNYYEV